MTFQTWLDTFIEEKQIDLDQDFTVEGPSGANHMTYRNVYDGIVTTSEGEQSQIKTILVKIDFQNGDVLHFFRHLAQAMAV